MSTATEEQKPMEQTQILCFMGTLTKDMILKRQNLTDDKIKFLNTKLKKLVNNPKLNMLDVEEFNRCCGLYVNFRYNGKFYSVSLKFNGMTVYFESSIRSKFEPVYDSDDEETHKFEGFYFRPFNQPLFPKTNKDGTKELTVDMYIDFVYERLGMSEFEHEYPRL